MYSTFNVPHKSIKDSKLNNQELNGKSTFAKTAITLLKAKKSQDVNLKKIQMSLIPKK